MKKGVRLAQGMIVVGKLASGQLLCTIPASIARSAKLEGGSVLEFEYFNMSEIKGLSIQERLYHIAKKEGLGGIIMVSVHDKGKND